MFLVAAMPIVVTPVHDKKKNEEIVSVKLSRNWYLYAVFSSLTMQLIKRKIPAIKEIPLPIRILTGKFIINTLALHD